MTLEYDMKRGADAARVLAEPVFQDAFSAVELAIHDLWAQSPVRDHEGQQQLRLMLKLLGDVKSVLETALEDGKAASRKLDELNRRVLTPAQWSGR